MNDSIKILLIVAFLALIFWNLGAGLYYLLVDRGQSKRTVKALTWRIGLSVVLFAVLVIGMASGLIQSPKPPPSAGLDHVYKQEQQ